jgi:hypothetical protein
MGILQEKSIDKLRVSTKNGNSSRKLLEFIRKLRDITYNNSTKMEILQF